MSDEERIAKLEAKVAELEATAKPPQRVEVREVRNWDLPPIDYTEGMSMPKNAMADLVNGVSAATMREIAKDRRATAPSSALPDNERPKSEQKPQGTGWLNPRPLKSGLQQ